MRLEGKNAIITGANRGIGRAIVEKFALEGANIWACARSQNPEFEMDMRKLAEQHHVWIRTLYFDLRNDEAIKNAVNDIRKEKTRVDILVNNAGIAKIANLSMLSISQIRDEFDCNFFGPLVLLQNVQKMMIKNGGSIINIGSSSGIYPEKGYSGYGTSKAALMFLSKVLAKELAPYHIRVNSVAPGMIETKMISYKSDEVIEEIIKNDFFNHFIA